LPGFKSLLLRQKKKDTTRCPFSFEWRKAGFE